MTTTAAGYENIPASIARAAQDNGWTISAGSELCTVLVKGRRCVSVYVRWAYSRTSYVGTPRLAYATTRTHRHERVADVLAELAR